MLIYVSPILHIIRVLVYRLVSFSIIISLTRTVWLLILCRIDFKAVFKPLETLYHLGGMLVWFWKNNASEGA